MQVREVMTKNPDVVAPDLTVDLVARQMKERDVGVMPVCDGERLVGMITERDIATRVVAEGLDPSKTTVERSMTSKVVNYCSENQDVSEATQIMRESQIRRLPVVNAEKHLVGILSLGDLAVDGDATLAGSALERISEPALPDDPA